jgi:hypothetical protein
MKSFMRYVLSALIQFKNVKNADYFVGTEIERWKLRKNIRRKSRYFEAIRNILQHSVNG